MRVSRLQTLCQKSNKQERLIWNITFRFRHNQCSSSLVLNKELTYKPKVLKVTLKVQSIIKMVKAQISDHFSNGAKNMNENVARLYFWSLFGQM